MVISFSPATSGLPKVSFLGWQRLSHSPSSSLYSKLEANLATMSSINDCAPATSNRTPKPFLGYKYLKPSSMGGSRLSNGIIFKRSQKSSSSFNSSTAPETSGSRTGKSNEESSTAKISFSVSFRNLLHPVLNLAGATPTHVSPELSCHFSLPMWTHKQECLMRHHFHDCTGTARHSYHQPR